MKKLTKAESGRLGAKKTWATRYEILKALSGHFDKEQNNNFLTWKTKHLKTLWNYVKKHKK